MYLMSDDDYDEHISLLLYFCLFMCVCSFVWCEAMMWRGIMEGG